jgi:uncharacterized alpha-E superfamily protein
MLSRVANSIYWMARNVQRAENIARFIEVTQHVILDQPDSTIDQWEPLVRATGDEDYFAEHYGDFTPFNVQQFLTFDREYRSSILTSITNARENARTVREAISSEAWEQLNTFYHFVRDFDGGGNAQPDASFYTAIVQNSYLFNGILDGTMTRNTGWRFANVGRMIEGADKTSRILDVKYFTLLRNVTEVNTTFDDLLWSAVLRSVSGFEMFRKEYHALTVERVVEFLVLNGDFPRAIYHCVREMRSSLRKIEGPVPETQNEAILKTTALIERLKVQDTKSIINGGLHEFIDSLQNSLNEIGAAINSTYFESRAFQIQQQRQGQS